MSLCLAFFAGWLFGNEIRPPALEDTRLAMWIAVGGGSLIGAIIAAGGR